MSDEGFGPDVVQTFGGLCTQVDPTQVPKGMSPNCSDVKFAPGVVSGRDGYAIHTTNSSPVTSIASFVRKGLLGQVQLPYSGYLFSGRALLAMYADGSIRVESPEGVENDLYTPGNEGSGNGGLDYLTNAGAGTKYGKNLVMKGVTLNQRQYMAFSDGQNPMAPPARWEPISAFSGTLTSGFQRLSRMALTNPSFAAAQGAAGTVTTGTRFIFYVGITGSGYYTRASNIVSINLADSLHTISLSGIGVGAGTSDIVTRQVFMTLPAGSVSGPYYSIPSLFTIPNNTATALANINFSDTSLVAGDNGTDLLTKVWLPPCVGLTKYGSRLVAWGVLPEQTGGLVSGLSPATNNIDGLSFDSTVLAWSGPAAGGSFAAANGAFGNVLTLAGAGAGSVGSTSITLNADFAVGLFKIGHRYRVRARVKMTAAGISGGGSIQVSLTAPSSTLVPSQAFPVTSDWSVQTTSATPPTNANTFVDGTGNVTLTINGFNIPSGQTAWVDEVAIVDDSPGDSASTLWVSVSSRVNSEDFDVAKSPVQISPGDGEAVRSCWQDSGNIYAAKDHSLWYATDNGSDPATWNFSQLSSVCGAAGVNAVDLANGFAILACRSGVYQFAGGQPLKISQEIEPTWRTIDPTQRYRIWVAIDAEKQVVRIGVPTNPAYQGCDKILILDYTEGWDIGYGYHYPSIGGNGRKWSIDNVKSNCGIMAERDDGSRSFFLGGGRTAANDLQVSYPPVTGWAATGWTLSPSPTITTSTGQPINGYNKDTEFQYTLHVPTTAIWVGPNNVPAGSYFTVSVRLRRMDQGNSPPNSFPYSAFLRSPWTNVADVPITITNSWQRFVATFGPAPNGTTPETFKLDLLTLSSSLTIAIGGIQCQIVQYDNGECPTFGSAVTGFSSGIIATPIAGQTYDFDGQITPTYETASLGAPLGRSTYDKFVLRAYGAGQMRNFLVFADGSTFALDAVQPPVLTALPRNDIEQKCSQSDTFVRFRATTGAKNATFSLRRLGYLFKASEYSAFRGKQT